MIFSWIFSPDFHRISSRSEINKKNRPQYFIAHGAMTALHYGLENELSDAPFGAVQPRFLPNKISKKSLLKIWVKIQAENNWE